MTSFITRCPHCSTNFRVGSSQLTAARGMVRCGACLEVFNAARALTRDPAAPVAPLPATAHAPAPAASQAAAAPAPAAQPTEPLWIHDDLDLDSLDLDEELAKLEAQERALAQDYETLARRATPPAGPATGPGDDEAWAEALLEGEREPFATPRQSLAAQLASGDLVQVDPLSATPPPPLTRPQDAPPQPAETPALRSPRIEPALSAAADDRTGAPLTTPPRRDPELPGNGLFELEDEPLQLDWRERRKPWGRWLGWGLLNLLAAGGLVAQYLAYNFDELARQDRYRPWFEQLCPTLGCELPSRVDISQIRSSNLVVRSHPEFEGALVVDAILYNRAAFSQPFPLLELRFADLAGKLVASRSFKPGEYLAGELAGQTEMPPQVPIHIALDILDPGAKAVNYSLSFQSPE